MKDNGNLTVDWNLKRILFGLLTYSSVSISVLNQSQKVIYVFLINNILVTFSFFISLNFAVHQILQIKHSQV